MTIAQVRVTPQAKAIHDSAIVVDTHADTTQYFLDPAFDHDFETENPFAMFLWNLVAEIGDVAKFEGWSGDGSPDYRVCREEAAQRVGGDADRTDEILRGEVALHEVPKEISSPEKTKERAEWVREKAAEYRKKLLEDLA